MKKLIFKVMDIGRQIYSHKPPSHSSESYLFLDKSNSYNYDYEGEQASDYLKKLLSENPPCMISRFGSAEIISLVTYLNRIDNSGIFLKSIRYISGKEGRFWYTNSTRYSMANNAGFFPATDSFLDQFGERYINDIKNIDVLGSWLVDEKRIIESFLPKAVRVPLRYLQPFYHRNPWSETLRGKIVLVIHPFVESIQSQYVKRKLLFKDEKVLPDFELKTLKAVQSIANTSVNFLNWFEALDYMCNQVANIEFDVAIIGAGAYGLPLASFVKQIGKKSVHIGGATQLLFGIRGKRWDKRPFYQELFNESWVRPLPSETPSNYRKVEDGTYW